MDLEIAEKQQQALTPKLKPFYFCPNCKRKIDTPKFVLKVSFGGNLNLTCGYCNKDGTGNPKGIVRIVGDPKKKKYIEEYRKRSGMTKVQMDKVLETHEIIPCDCGQPDCKKEFRIREIKKEEPKTESDESN